MPIALSSSESAKRFVEALLAVNGNKEFWQSLLSVSRLTWQRWQAGRQGISKANAAAALRALDSNGLLERVTNAWDALSPEDPNLFRDSQDPGSTQRTPDEAGHQPEDAGATNGETEIFQLETYSLASDDDGDSDDVSVPTDGDLEWPTKWLRSSRQELFLPVHKFVWLYPAEKTVVATPAFQRLRLLSQLGMSYVAFPGATHRRFEHVLGTVAVTDKVVRAVNHNCEKSDPLENAHWKLVSKKLTLQERAFVRLAALLHDIGHLPYGHTIEDELGLIRKKHDEPERLKLIFERKQWYGMPEEPMHPAEKEARQPLTQVIDEMYNDLLNPDTARSWPEDSRWQVSTLAHLSFRSKEYAVEIDEALIKAFLSSGAQVLPPSVVAQLEEASLSIPENLAQRAELVKAFSRALSEAIALDEDAIWAELRQISIEVPSTAPVTHTFHLSASQLAQLIILKPTRLPSDMWEELKANHGLQGKNSEAEYAAKVLDAIERAGFRLGVCRDIVGNTICSDLLDYLHRDWYHTGKIREFDERIFQYLEMRSGKSSPTDHERTHIVISIDSPAGPRLDGVSAILDLLESRYQLAETVLFHKTKLRATAMLERALMFYYQVLENRLGGTVLDSTERDEKIEDELLEFLLQNPEEELIHSMVNSMCFGLYDLERVEVGGHDAFFERRLSELQNSSLQTGRRIAYALMCRRYFKDLVIKYDGQLVGDYTRERAIDEYTKSENASLRRQVSLELLEYDFRLPLGSLAFYCPGDKMNAKVAEVKLLVKGVVKSFNDHKAQVKQELTGGHLDAQMNRFRSLWRVILYYDKLIVQYEVCKAIKQGGKHSSHDDVREQLRKFKNLLSQGASAAVLRIPDDGVTPDDTYKRVLKEVNGLPWFKHMPRTTKSSDWPNVQQFVKLDKAARSMDAEQFLRKGAFPSGVSRV